MGVTRFRNGFKVRRKGPSVRVGFRTRRSRVCDSHDRCASCKRDVSLESIHLLCDDRYCYKCARDLVLRSLTQGPFPPKCHDWELQPEHVRRILHRESDSEFLKDFFYKLQELRLDTSLFGSVSCPVHYCQQLVPFLLEADGSRPPTARCAACEHVVCLGCAKVDHHTQPCGAAPDASHKWGDECNDCVGVSTCCCCNLETRDTFLLLCDHRYCAWCLRRHVMEALNDVSKFPPKCCKWEVPPELVRRVFEILGKSPMLEDYFYRLQQTQYNTSLFKLVTCPTRLCEQIVPILLRRGKVPKIVTCLVCEGPICVSCSLPAHGTTPCSTDSLEDLRLREDARKRGWVECPECHAIIERTGGCLHMTCRLCKYEFCFQCRAKFKECVHK
eukprot:Gregarina_sp_Pseudo_9__2464@NODE_274_length_3319_cov_11_965549_g257_i0_p2_GENE_NODE_274_length_3319_cov_11_965549_g257_i0NODE_274_length_3319_cov_11_965549_g257_i0_p2_ORF_typecomplete_len387_score61_25IBR/PF01485_21/5_4e03IBR/PF01485_21/0_09IBR/PF01485_21/1_8e04IBR/PF01485_21/2_4e05IBR/PF01485_21/5e11_NODE_274_length_3319_cov_11_965549_g257_i02241384